jgi:type VI secretion system secreted protein VgrG
MATSQNKMEVAVFSALGTDVLLFRRMTGSECLSGLSEYELEMLSETADLHIDKVLGTLLTVSVVQPLGGTRYFNGYVTRFSTDGRLGRLYRYRATIRPWLWFLTRAADCRVFQEMNVIDIIKSVFGEYGFADVDTASLGSHPVLPYCVQYRETDFNFVSRLMERAGIYYFFRSAMGAHTMVLTDTFSAHHTIPGYESIPYTVPNKAGVQLGEAIHSWSLGGEIQSGSYSLKSYDFEKPATSSSSGLLVNSALQREHSQAALAIYDYSSTFIDRTEGEAYARARIEALHTRYQVVHATTTARGIYPGCLFALAAHPRADQNASYLMMSAHYVLTSAGYESESVGTDPAVVLKPEPVLQCEFSALHKSQTFRPDLNAFKPVVQGPQTAMVVGKAGEEIWTDKYGRIKVQFHWDRLGKEDEKSSCWVRVAQGWAGKRWGSLFIPRIGSEVIVSFLEGDPDQPLVTGSVYNAVNMPPYPLPDNATRSVLKTNSSKGGDGSNELRFEDKKGSEQIYMHAEKDLDVRVENDVKTLIGKDRHLKVKGDTFSEVCGALHLKIDGNRNEKIGGDASLDAASDIFYKAGMIFAVDAGKEIHLKAGGNLVIEAGTSITLKAGGGSIVIGPTSVAVTGNPVLLNSGGSPGSGSGAKPVAPKQPKEADDGKK